jgi:hypothetical protein
MKIVITCNNPYEIAALISALTDEKGNFKDHIYSFDIHATVDANTHSTLSEEHAKEIGNEINRRLGHPCGNGIVG